MPDGAMERRDVLLANNIRIGLRFGFFRMTIKSLALPDPGDSSSAAGPG